MCPEYQVSRGVFLARGQAVGTKHAVEAIPDGENSDAAEFTEITEEWWFVSCLESSPQQTTRNAGILLQFVNAVDIQSVIDIDVRAIQEYLVHLQELGRSPKTIRNHWGAISQFCSFCVGRGYLLENPASGIHLPKLEETVPIYLTRREVKLALEIAREADRYCEVALAIFTGLRMSEMRRLMWADVMLQEGRATILVRKAKNKKPRRVPINAVAREALVEQKQRYGHLAYVFPGKAAGGDPKRDWSESRPRGNNWWKEDALKPLQERIKKFQTLPKGSTGRGWHLLRHTFASLCVQADQPIDLYQVGKWLGHSSTKQTERYSHLAPGYNEAIERIF